MLLVFMRYRYELTNQIPVLNSLHGYIALLATWQRSTLVVSIQVGVKKTNYEY